MVENQKQGIYEKQILKIFENYMKLESPQTKLRTQRKGGRTESGTGSRSLGGTQGRGGKPWLNMFSGGRGTGCHSKSTFLGFFALVNNHVTTKTGFLKEGFNLMI